MTCEEFRAMVTAAVAGSHEALEEILKLYMPLIIHQSTVDGQLDEDLQQYIMIHIALNISKFRI